MKNSMKRVLKILTREEKRKLLWLFLVMLIGAILESLSVASVVPLVTAILDPNAGAPGNGSSILLKIFEGRGVKEAMIALILFMVVLFLLKNAYMLWQAYVQNREMTKIRRRVQKSMLHYYLTQDYNFFMNANSGDILRTITVDSDYFFALMNQQMRFLTNAAIVLSLVIVIFVIHPVIMLCCSVLLLLEYAIVVRRIYPFLRRYGKSYREALGRGNGLIVELLRGIKSVKVRGTEQFFETRYSKVVDAMTKARMIERSFDGASRYLMEAMTVCFFLLFALYNVIRGVDMSGLVPAFSAFALAALRILPGISNMSNAVSYAGYYEGSLQKTEEIMSALDESSEAADDQETLSFCENIRIDDVTFHYPDRPGPVLSHASLQIEKGRVIGIQGASGAGKTTLSDLLLGLLEPQEGTVFLDGEPVKTDSLAWRKLFAYIPQNVFLLNGTIRENIVFGENPQRAEDNRLWEALEAAQIKQFVESLPEGLDTEVGEAGVRLSGGQVQRLGVARALYTDAPILLFDEATSALDEKTEAAMMESIMSLHRKKTMLFIAHRAAVMDYCDEVYVVEDGVVRQVR